MLARVYTEWEGHENDAFAIYDQLTNQDPNEFRAWLAKGLLLKRVG